jgi:acyl-CoA thioesterase I
VHKGPVAFRIVIIVFSIVGADLLIGLVSGYRDYKGLPEHAPRDFLKQGRSQHTRFVVVSAGDSVTQGTLSADYVAMLRHRLGAKGYEFVNAGVNGEQSADLLKRTRAIIDCKPDVITILIGTNDVKAAIAMAGTSRSAGAPDDLDQFRRNLEQIATVLQSETNASIALLSIPPFGENLDSTPNRITQRYNKVIEDLSTARHLTYLALYERMSELIRHSEVGGQLPNLVVPLGRPTGKVALRHYFLWQSWDQISRVYGFQFHTDGIHLNTSGAEVVANLVQGWLAKIDNGFRNGQRGGSIGLVYAAPRT